MRVTTALSPRRCTESRSITPSHKHLEEILPGCVIAEAQGLAAGAVLAAGTLQNGGASLATGSVPRAAPQTVQVKTFFTPRWLRWAGARPTRIGGWSGFTVKVTAVRLPKRSVATRVWVPAYRRR